MRVAGIHRIWQIVLMVALAVWPWQVGRADLRLDVIAVGSHPVAVVLNPLTNRIYAANQDSDTVTVIDGATLATSTIAVGDAPLALAVNPATNRIYVANSQDGTVTVIRGSDHTASTVTVGQNPRAIAINPLYNRIYVANTASDTVTVIDGGNHFTMTVAVGDGPWALALNPTSDKIYVANSNAGTLTVIDGDTQATVNVTVGQAPRGVAVNPVTNKIYVANYSSGTVSVVDGSSLSVTSVTVGSQPQAIAVDPLTNKVYVANRGSNSLTVIDGATLATTALSVGSQPQALAVDTQRNKIYVANLGAATVTVVDGATLARTTLDCGQAPSAAAVNPLTGKVYIANQDSNTVAVFDEADYRTATVAVGSQPNDIETNPVTNDIYTANSNANSVTVIQGGNHSTATLGVGAMPNDLAVNPITNRIYVANTQGGTVSVLNGQDHSLLTTLDVPGSPMRIVVNPLANKIFVTSQDPDVLSVINGVDHSITTVTMGLDPYALAVNPETEEVFVANRGDDTVTVVDGEDYSVHPPIAVGDDPIALAVDPATNTVYIANRLAGTVTVLDGSGKSVLATVTVGQNPYHVAVNSLTHRIYVANRGSGTLTVINGQDLSTLTIPAAAGTCFAGVGLADNRAFAANLNAGSLLVLDGLSQVTTTVNTGSNPLSLSDNPVTGKLYVANRSSNNVTVVTPGGRSASPLVTTITPLKDHFTVFPTPTFTFNASSSFSPVSPKVQGVYYQVDTLYGPWLKASYNPETLNYSGATPTLSAGMHVLYAFATDSMEATSINPAGSPVVGRLSAYAFWASPQGSITEITAHDPDPSAVGQPVTVQFRVTVNGSPTGTVTVSDGQTSCSASPEEGSCSLIFTSPGEKTLIARYTGDIHFSDSTSYPVSHTVRQYSSSTTITSDVPDPSQVGQPVTVSYMVTASGSTPTGEVTVSDGQVSCSGTVAQGSCTLVFYSPGERQLTAAYAGDDQHTGSVSAPVDHTVVRADTTTTITSHAPNPSGVGQAVTVAFTVSATNGTPTGEVTVGDGSVSCTATVAEGSCELTFDTPGIKTLTAVYSGDENYAGSTSAPVTHSVKFPTTTWITGHQPNPSALGQTVTVSFSVTSPNGAPSGNVTVSDGVLSCTATVAQGSCPLTFTTAGNKLLTATYAGDDTFAGSVSASVSHTVNKADTTTAITSDLPDPSEVNQPVTVKFSVTSSGGTPTGNVTVRDDLNSATCTATVAQGACILTFPTSGARMLLAVYAGDDNFHGSTSAGVSHVVTPDRTPPVTQAVVTGEEWLCGPNRCYIRQATVTLNVNETATTYYRLDGGQWRTYTAPLLLEGEGPHQVEFYSVDQAGNREATRLLQVRITALGGQVLDDFHRADGLLGAGWSGSSSSRYYVLIDQQVRVRRGGVLYWRSTSFGVGQEAFFTLRRVDLRGAQGLLLKVQGATPNYRKGAIALTYYAPQQRLLARTYQPGRGWRVIAYFRVQLSDGDVLGAQALADGTLRIYVNCQYLGSGKAGDFFAGKGGYIGIWDFSTVNRAAFDDFGGGDLPAGP